MRLSDSRYRYAPRQVQSKQTGKALWDEAKDIAAKWEKAGAWDGEVERPVPLPEPAQAHRAAIERTVTGFLAELQENAAFATHKKY
jgi:hypothetical protein